MTLLVLVVEIYDVLLHHDPQTKHILSYKNIAEKRNGSKLARPIHIIFVIYLISYRRALRLTKLDSDGLFRTSILVEGRITVIN